MKILFASSEVEPFSKTGGLADVSHALPAELASRGHQLLVVTPQYRSVKSADLKRLGEIRLRFPFGEESAVVRGTNLSNRHRVAFLDHPGFYARDGIYRGQKEYTDNHRRFAFLSIGALSVAQVLQFNPEIIHLNDWQTALAALALDRGYRGPRWTMRARYSPSTTSPIRAFSPKPRCPSSACRGNSSSRRAWSFTIRSIFSRRGSSFP